MGVGGLFPGRSLPYQDHPPSGSLKGFRWILQGQAAPSLPSLGGTLQRLSNSLSITCLNHTEQTSPPSPTSVWSTYSTGHHLHRWAHGLTCTLEYHQKQDAPGTGRNSSLSPPPRLPLVSTNPKGAVSGSTPHWLPFKRTENTPKVTRDPETGTVGDTVPQGSPRKKSVSLTAPPPTFLVLLPQSWWKHSRWFSSLFCLLWEWGN